MENYGVGSTDAEWPNNIISNKAVVYGSGAITRAGTIVHHAVDPDELALCQRLAAEVARMMAGMDVGMGSESSDPFREFFIAANVNEPVPKRIDEHMIRSKFGGTIFPPATITIEPMTESGTWWSEVEIDPSKSTDDCLRPWRSLIEWFRCQPVLLDSAFVRIGDRRALWKIELDKEMLPKGTELTGCVLPRLALGLTKNGSFVGLFGFSVQT
jgi:hypothetical protein